MSRPRYSRCPRPAACMLHQPADMRVLITDGGERVALAVARSLVRAGHVVYVSAPTRLSLAGASRGARPCVAGRDPLADPAGYVAEIAGLVERERIGLLLPLTDPSVEAVLARPAASPPRPLLPIPDLARYRPAS